MIIKGFLKTIVPEKFHIPGEDRIDQLFIDGGYLYVCHTPSILRRGAADGKPIRDALVSPGAIEVPWAGEKQAHPRAGRLRPGRGPRPPGPASRADPPLLLRTRAYGENSVPGCGASPSAEPSTAWSPRRSSSAWPARSTTRAPWP
ncbi:MAG: hypothetical protein MZV70_69820 [Desulfobacterales bacterium]|nr:hypothetical protein [Desulfobacterales bacterium]